SDPRYVQTHEEMMSELLERGLAETTLTLHPRPSLLPAHVPSDLHGKRTEAVTFDNAALRRLATALATLDEPLEVLERRGISLRRFAIEQATSEGLLPRYRVILGTDVHWFDSKQKTEDFLTAQGRDGNGRLSIADADDAGAAIPGDEPVTDLHEVRTINETLKRLKKEFDLSLNDLIPPPPKNAEAVRPYQLVSGESDRWLISLRELVATLRDLGGKGLTYTRFKGLGEMNPEELFETAMNPETRVLKQVTLEDAAAAEEIFRVLMGDHVEPRREFIEKHALDVRDLDI